MYPNTKRLIPAASIVLLLHAAGMVGALAIKDTTTTPTTTTTTVDKRDIPSQVHMTVVSFCNDQNQNCNRRNSVWYKHGPNGNGTLIDPRAQNTTFVDWDGHEISLTVNWGPAGTGLFFYTKQKQDQHCLEKLSVSKLEGNVWLQQWNEVTCW